MTLAPSTLVSAWIVAVFVAAYALVVAEPWTGLRKSVPVLVAAAVIWATLAVAAPAADAFRAVFVDFAELFFFLVAAMSYVSALDERQVFEALRSSLARRALGYRALFWLTGGIAFFLSALIDNLTTALVMGAVVIAVGAGERRFIGIACVNLVVAANAGGAWSAFGDITTLMVWQQGRAGFFDFFWLLPPAAVSWVVPAAMMHFALPKGAPPPRDVVVQVKVGGLAICALFALTIAITVAAHHFLGLPPVFGMLAGLGALKLAGPWIARRELRRAGREPDTEVFDVFRLLARAEWDTLLFFCGVMLCVGGLAAAGLLEGVARLAYGEWGPTAANVAMGIASAVVDNIPIMYAVLEMNPVMPLDQWLLAAYCAGVGGSLLAVGSAAGVALMGAARGMYTFGSHLRWTGAVALGYVAGVVVQRWLSHVFLAP